MHPVRTTRTQVAAVLSFLRSLLSALCFDISLNPICLYILTDDGLLGMHSLTHMQTPPPRNANSHRGIDTQDCGKLVANSDCRPQR